jgi:hypothetical protein
MLHKHHEFYLNIMHLLLASTNIIYINEINSSIPSFFKSLSIGSDFNLAHSRPSKKRCQESTARTSDISGYEVSSGMLEGLFRAPRSTTHCLRAWSRLSFSWNAALTAGNSGAEDLSPPNHIVHFRAETNRSGISHLCPNALLQCLPQSPAVSSTVGDTAAPVLHWYAGDRLGLLNSSPGTKCWDGPWKSFVRMQAYLTTGSTLPQDHRRTYCTRGENPCVP